MTQEGASHTLEGVCHCGAVQHFDGYDTFDGLPRDGKLVRDYWF